MIVNKGKLAEILGVSTNTLGTWLTKGMPTVAKPHGHQKEWQFDPAAVVAWRESQLRERLTGRVPADLMEAKLKKLALEASMLQLDYENRKASLIPAEEIERGIGKAFAIIRNRILSIPNKIASHLSLEARNLLDAELIEALSELSEENVLCNPEQSPQLHQLSA